MTPGVRAANRKAGRANPNARAATVQAGDGTPASRAATAPVFARKTASAVGVEVIGHRARAPARPRATARRRDKHWRETGVGGRLRVRESRPRIGGMLYTNQRTRSALTCRYRGWWQVGQLYNIPPCDQFRGMI